MAALLLVSPLNPLHYSCHTNPVSNAGALLLGGFASPSRYQNRKSITSPSPCSPLSLTLLLPGSRLACTLSPKHMMDTHSATQRRAPSPTSVEILLTAASRTRFHYSSARSQESHTNDPNAPPAPPSSIPFRLWMEWGRPAGLLAHTGNGGGR